MPHIHELFDFTVTLFIVHEGRVLLVNHPRYGKWIPPGGHIELDETPDQALFREIAEETGLEVEMLGTKPSAKSPGSEFMFTPNYLDVHEANAPHKHIGLTYFVRATSDKFRLSDEHTDMKWFTLDELEQPSYSIDDVVKFYAVEAVRLEAETRQLDKPA